MKPFNPQCLTGPTSPKNRTSLLTACVVGAALALSACKKEEPPTSPVTPDTVPQSSMSGDASSALPADTPPLTPPPGDGTSSSSSASSMSSSSTPAGASPSSLIEESPRQVLSVTSVA
ncbi:hypothetical protein VVD49_19160 [Uliginosibacterium sp. H3]|uniref:Uncharacterized protein n=1 Tax=Uliginosibacterium silvisoli TaxID=3114758 RepID=A0ABU6K9A8_9RHOO|nr:hypothetical protein [Uliginosibacterium sp. H3]